MSIYAMEQRQGACFCIDELCEKEETSLHFHSVRGWPTGLFFDSIQLIVFKITCSFQAVVWRDSCAQMKWLWALHSNYCTNFLPVFTMCPMTLLMNILDICANNQLPTGEPLGCLWGSKCCGDDADSNSVHQRKNNKYQSKFLIWVAFEHQRMLWNWMPDFTCR